MGISEVESVFLKCDGDTKTFLTNPLEIEGYACGVMEISGNLDKYKNGQKRKKQDQLFLCSDICKEVFVNGIKLPVLRQILRSPSGNILQISNIVWLKVLRPTITSIRLYITNEIGEVQSFNGGWLQCSVLFIASK